MKAIPYLLLPLSFSILLAACSTSPVGEPEDEDPEVPEGPGFLTGDKGEYSLSNFFSSEKRAEKKRDRYYSGSRDINMPAIDEQSFEDFELFKAWRRAQQPGSENYQEYQEWRAYQQYLRYKAEQERAPQSQPSQ